VSQHLKQSTVKLETKSPSYQVSNDVELSTSIMTASLSFSHNLRKSDLRSNFIEVGLDDRGKSTIVRIESPQGDMLHTYDPHTHIARSYSQIGSDNPACVTRYNVRELKWNGTVKQEYANFRTRVVRNPVVHANV
jgi:hypothetical protein